MARKKKCKRCSTVVNGSTIDLKLQHICKWVDCFERNSLEPSCIMTVKQQRTDRCPIALLGLKHSNFCFIARVCLFPSRDGSNWERFLSHLTIELSILSGFRENACNQKLNYRRVCKQGVLLPQQTTIKVHSQRAVKQRVFVVHGRDFLGPLSTSKNEVCSVHSETFIYSTKSSNRTHALIFDAMTCVQVCSLHIYIYRLY